MKRRLPIIAVFLVLGAVVNVGVAWVIFYLQAHHWQIEPDMNQTNEVVGGDLWSLPDDWVVFSEHYAAHHRFFDVHAHLKNCTTYDERLSRLHARIKSTYLKFPFTNDENLNVRIKVALSEFHNELEQSLHDYAAIGVHEASIRIGWPMRSLVAENGSRSEHASLEGVPYDSESVWYSETGSIWASFRSGVALSATPPNSINDVLWKRYPIMPLPLGFAVNTLFYASLLGAPVLGYAALKRRRRAKRGLCTGCAYDVTGVDVCPECGRQAAGQPRV